VRLPTGRPPKQPRRKLFVEDPDSYFSSLGEGLAGQIEDWAERIAGDKGYSRGHTVVRVTRNQRG
jgi:hypothetical protein